MFSMALQGKSCRTIACSLNRPGSAYFGRKWLHNAVYKIFTNPMYAGHNVWNRTTTKMRSKRKIVPSQEWIRKPEAFPPIIDQQTFERVQILMRIRPLLSPNRVILRKVRQLLKTQGYL